MELQPSRTILSAEASRVCARSRLREWEPFAPAYRGSGSRESSDCSCFSGLSRYLTHRQILEEEVLKTLLDRFPPTVIRRFVSELCGRTYWKGWMEHHPSLWTTYQRRVAALSENMDVRQREMFERVRNSATGLDCFDEWNRELVQEGYLHKQERMWFASIWIFTLRLPWELGAAHFLRHALDGDVASNTLSWRWIAGLQGTSKPYLADPEDIRQGTEGRFKPAGLLCREAEVPFEAERFPLVELDALDATDQALSPSLSESPAGLLLTSEDLVPEIGIMSEAPFHSIAAFSAHDVFDAIGLSHAVMNYKIAGMREAAQRGASHWDGALIDGLQGAVDRPSSSPAKFGESLQSRMRVYSETVDEWVPAVTQWARLERLRVVRMHAPAVGPWRDRIGRLRTALSRHGIRLKVYRRSWDALHWPYAKSDYNAFGQDLEERLAEFFTGQ